MCSSDLKCFNGFQSTFLPEILKKAKVLRLISSRVRPSSTGRRKRLKKRCRVLEEEEMKMVNMLLCLENREIMEENNRLRERALFLSQENRALIAQLQTTEKSSKISPLL